MGLVGLVGGIGFTMALFVAQLAYPAGLNLETAKLGILTGSGAAAVLAFALGRALLPSRPLGPAASSESAAESSTID